MGGKRRKQVVIAAEGVNSEEMQAASSSVSGDHETAEYTQVGRDEWRELV